MNQKFLNTLSKEMLTSLTFDNMTQLATGYRSATNSTISDHTQGQGNWENGVAYESVSLAERQRISNKLRAALGLKPKTLKTGE